MSELLTIAEAADRLRVNQDTVYRWVKQGTIEAVTLPHLNGHHRYYRIKRENVNKQASEVQHD